MKKFTKIALIVVLITGIVGGCLAGVGLVFGGSVRSITGNFTNSRLYHVLRRACRDHEGPWWDMDDDFNDYRHSLGDLDNFNHGSIGRWILLLLVQQTAAAGCDTAVAGE